MKRSTDLRRQLLVTLGLSSKEAVLYETLLQHGSLSAASLEKLTGLKKNTYTLLKTLERRGLVQKFVKDGRSHYQVGSPERLNSYLEDQEHALKETKALLKESLPTLIAEYKQVVDQPTITHYHGEKGFREVLDLTYAPNKQEIYGAVGWTKPTKVLEDVMHKYSHLRVERGINTHALNNNTQAGKEFQKRSKNPANLSEVQLADTKKYPLPAEIDVWNDTIAMMSFENQDFQGIVIDHPEFAETLRNIFKLLFSLLRQQNEG